MREMVHSCVSSDGKNFVLRPEGVCGLDGQGTRTRRIESLDTFYLKIRNIQ